MASRVAVYIDFDNVVISRYDQVHHGARDSWRRDDARDYTGDGDSEIDTKLAAARVDIGALIDYAASFGTVAQARAYADWSVPANAAYRKQLVDRAVDLTQLFSLSGTKNGADIRLAVDAVEDLMKYPDLTHVVIVGGDSDYVALAQRCKRLGRFVIGIGVSGSTGRALINACDEFRVYDALPGVSPPEPPASGEGGAQKQKSRRRRSKKASDPQTEATDLLVRAIEIAQDKVDESEWLHAGGVKSQMQRMDPSFKEKALGYKTFSEFISSREDVVEINPDTDDLTLRLR